MSRTYRLALTLVALLAFAACSGDAKSASPSTSTAPAPSTKTAYVKAANAICTTISTRVAALGNPTDSSQAADVNDEAAAITADGLRKLRALPVPSGDAAALAAVYAKVDAFLQDAPAISTRLRAGDQPGAATAERKLEADISVANAAATVYGLTVCGS